MSSPKATAVPKLKESLQSDFDQVNMSRQSVEGLDMSPYFFWLMYRTESIYRLNRQACAWYGHCLTSDRWLSVEDHYVATHACSGYLCWAVCGWVLSDYLLNRLIRQSELLKEFMIQPNKKKKRGLIFLFNAHQDLISRRSYTLNDLLAILVVVEKAYMFYCFLRVLFYFWIDQ